MFKLRIKTITRGCIGYKAKYVGGCGFSGFDFDVCGCGGLWFCGVVGVVVIFVLSLHLVDGGVVVHGVVVEAVVLQAVVAVVELGLGEARVHRRAGAGQQPVDRERVRRRVLGSYVLVLNDFFHEVLPSKSAF